MERQIISLFCVILFSGIFLSCGVNNTAPRIGVSFGVGPATRWVKERGYMEERAKELGARLDIRFNTTDKPKTQRQDCIELIDSGIKVLIIIPRNINDMKEIVEYARTKKVKVVSYARLISKEQIDLFVGYDSTRIGQTMGQYLAETVDKGDYIILSGDQNDHNASLLYDGVIRFLDPIKNNIRIILDAPVPEWSPEAAKELVKKAVTENGNTVDAILAPNDKIAGACVEALAELGVAKHVAITGMDAELDAVRRIAEGTQDMTIYMDLQELAYTAINEAYNMATRKQVNVNAEFDNRSGVPIPSLLITGKLLTKKNIDRILIKSGYFTREEVYGK